MDKKEEERKHKFMREIGWKKRGKKRGKGRKSENISEKREKGWKK